VNDGGRKMPHGAPLRAERRRAQAFILQHGIADYQAYVAQEHQWRALRQQRRAMLVQRHQDDLAWRQERLHLRQLLIASLSSGLGARS
jgi:hypothetical protein